MKQLQDITKAFKFSKPGAGAFTDFWALADFWKYYFPNQPLPAIPKGKRCSIPRFNWEAMKSQVLCCTTSVFLCDLQRGVLEKQRGVSGNMCLTDLRRGVLRGAGDV